jgi:hypothetical protein
MLQVRVVHVGKPTRSNALASCKVELISEDGEDVVVVCDARVLRNKSGELWVGFHSQTIADWQGKISYIPTIEFSPSLKRRISDAVLSAFEEDVVGAGARQRLYEFSGVRESSVRGGNDGR